MLAPVLEEIAEENTTKTKFYKINTDEFRDIAASFRVRGIPHVAFVKNKTIVDTLIGLHQKASYVDLIKKHADR